MNKINCDIIKDLLPLYTDGVCSEATKQCVEAHLETCDDCRNTAALYKNTALSGDTLERQSLDGLKKVRNKIKLQRFFNYATFISLIYVCVWIFFIRKNIPSISAVNVMCALCMAANLCAYMGYKGQRNLPKKDYILGAVSLGADIYLAFLILNLFRKIQMAEITQAGTIQSGQSVYTQLMVFFFLQAAYFLYILACTVIKGRNYSVPACINIMSIFLSVKYFLCMTLMETPETLVSSFLHETAQIAAIGVLGIAAGILLSKYRKQKGA